MNAVGWRERRCARRDPAVVLVDHARPLAPRPSGRPLRVDLRLFEGGLRVEPLREVPLARVEVGQVELRCNPDSQAAPPGWTPRPAHGYHGTMAYGSTDTNAMRADCIAAGSSGLVRAQAMLSAGTTERRAWAVARRSLRSLPPSSSAVQFTVHISRVSGGAWVVGAGASERFMIHQS